jgi:RNA polymerase sigma-70 factor (ECF subfamily)
MSGQYSDQQLVERVQQGDKNAFNLLVMKYQNKVMSLIGRYVRNQADVADVTQEAFIKAYRALANFRGDSAFYTWLYRIGINTAKNHLVSLGKRPKAMDANEIEEMENYESMSELRVSETPESTMMSNQIAETVNGAIQNLPDELREAISLREIDGLCYEEISELMDCPIGTVRSRIFRARETIAEKLKPLIETTNKRW